jgi:hypothetical protein
MSYLQSTQQAGSNYQFTSLDQVINQFIVAYVGEDKIISKVKRVDVAFHAQRALQELSFDTFKSTKAQEVTVPPSLMMQLPKDYVNYTKVSWVDSAGIKHLLYPTSKTSNPSSIPLQDSDGDYALTAIGTLVDADATIVLDAEYGYIKVGMIVSAPNIPAESTVLATSNSGGITTIEISSDATYSGTETLTFTNADGSLVAREESTYILENVTWAVNEDKITQAPNTDVSNITVGMLVSHEDFPIGTTVVDVNGAVITTSEPSTLASIPTTNEVTFISTISNSTTWANYKSGKSEELNHDALHHHHDHDHETLNRRYGLDPQYAQANGSFYIDENMQHLHFSSNISGKTVILDYISDSLGTDGEMQVHKFAEEAMYKCIAYAILSTKANIQEYIVQRYRKERFAAVRTAKLRLSNLKLEELTQILRGKSKQIKH